MSSSARSRQPDHRSVFGMSNDVWCKETVKFYTAVSTGSVVSYLGEYAAGAVPYVTIGTISDTVCSGNSTFSKLANYKVAGVSTNAYAAGSNGEIVTFGYCSMLKESTSISSGDYLALGGTGAGHVTPKSGAYIVPSFSFGICVNDATAGDSYVDAYMLMWRM